MSDTETVAEPVDLTPRDVAGPRRRATKRWPKFVGAAVVLGLGVVVFMGLTQATVYFRFVDDAVARRAELGDDFFRMQGNVVDGSIRQTDDGATFELTRKGVTVEVEHHGAEPALFGDPRIPVVVEGHFEGDRFISQRIVVNHDATYEEDQGERLREARDEANSEADQNLIAPVTSATDG